MQLIRPSSVTSQLPRVDQQQSSLRKKSLQQMNLKRTLKPTQVDTPQENMKKNQVVESLNIYEKCIFEYDVELFALKGTSQQQSEVETLFAQLNKYAMKILNQQVSPEMCVLILQWIIEHRSFQEIPNQICLAYNNLGCVYRRTGQTQLAFNSFENALNLVQMYDQLQMATITYLNITAVLSQMNMHDKALKAAIKAIDAGKQEFKAHQIETIKYLALAHYNKALELEALHRQEEAVKQFKRAIEFVGEHLGNNDPLFKKFYVAHQQAKQRYVVSLTTQNPEMLRTVLSNKKQYEVPTDESISMTPQVKTQKNFYIKQEYYAEDTIKVQDSSATIKKGQTDEEDLQRKKSKKEEHKQDDNDTKKSSQSEVKIKKNQLEEIQLLEVSWSNSEPSDTEVKKQRLNESNPPMKLPQGKVSNNKEQRLNFLNKQNAFKLISDNLLEKEQQIIREIEGQMYNTQNIKMIQAQVRMKQERKKFLKLKQQKKDQGTILPSDELKLKKFQRFIRKKLAQLKIRAVTRKIVLKNKLKKYPKMENKAFQKVVALLEAQKVFKRMALHKQILQIKQFQTIRQSFCQPELLIDGVRQLAKESYIFTFAITNDDTFVRFALVNGVKNKRKQNQYYFEMDIQTLLTALGLLRQYIDDLECYVIDENQLVKNLKKLETIASQFLGTNEVEGKYFVRNLTDNQRQFRLALARVSLILQDLILIDNNKFLIQGINNFDYNEIVPAPEEFHEFKPPLSVKPPTEFELKRITIIQSFFKGYIQRLKLRRATETKKKQVIRSELIKTNSGEYLQIVKSCDMRTKKIFIYIIDQATSKKSNDLEIKPVVFQNMGEITKENLHDFLVIDLQGPSIEYSEEAQYMIQKQEEYEKRGGKHIISKKSKDEYITLIQKAALSYLFKKQFRIKQANKQKFNLCVDKKNIDREMLVRRVLIYGQDMNSRASLTTLYLETEKTDPEKSLMGQSEYQSVTITSKNLEHVYAFDKVIPYFQKLFYPLQRSQMITIAQKMVEESRIIKNKKGEQKVECRGVDEVYGELQALMGEEDGNNTKKENTLKARMKLSSSWRVKYMQQVVDNLEDRPEFRLNLIADANKQSNFIKVVQIKHKLHGFKIGAKVKFSKHVDVDNQDSIRSYVNNVLPTTEYGTDPTLFQEEQEMHETEQRLASQTQIDQEVIFDSDIIVNENHFSCKITYYINEEQFTTIAENQDNKQRYYAVLNRSELCTEYDIPYSYIKDNVQSILIPLFEYNEEAFVFDLSPVKLKKILDDFKLFEINDKLQEKIQLQQQFTSEQVPADQITDKIKLALYQLGNLTYLYEFHRVESLVRIIIEFKSTKEHRVIEIDTHQFQSKYVDEKMPILTNLKVIQFFKEFTKSLTKQLVINEQDHTHNFEEIRPNVSLLLREKFIEKIQGMLLVKRMVEKFRMYKQLKHSKLYMHKFIVNNGQHYIEVLYFLIKKSYNLQIIIREITCVTPQGHLVERSKTLKSKRRLREKGFLIDLKELKEDSKQLIAQMTKKQDQMDLQRIDFNQLAEYQQMKTIEYYRTLLTPLILIIQQNLIFHFNRFQLELPLNVRMRETKLALRKKKTFVASKLSIGHLMIAAEKMQAAYRKMQHEQWYLTKVQRIRGLEEKNKNMGKFIKRTFKKIDEDSRLQYYIVNIYQKQGKGEGQIKFTYELIPVFKYERKNKLRQTYVWDPTQLIDIGSGQLYNYFLNQIYIEKSIIKFSSSNFQQAMPQEIEQQQPSLNNSLIHEQASSFEDENGQKILVQKDVKEVLIDQEQQGDSVVNVVYTNARPSREKRQFDQSALNTTTFQVNLQEIKQLYPHLNIKDANTMKIVSQNLIKGVKMDQQSGSVLLDKGRIQQSFISVVGRSPVSQINFQQSQIQMKSRLVQRPHQNNALEKTTVTYNGEKFLIVISFISRKIEKILQQNRDTVFEEFERVLQVKATNLKSKEKDPIIWNVTPDDAEILTHESDVKQMAAVIAKKVQVLNDKFMYLCNSEQDLLQVKGRAESTVILFVESIMKPIQNKFRNRQLQQNYKLYRDVLKSCQTENVFYHRQTSNLNTKNSMFIVIFIEEKNKKVNLNAWDATDKLYFYELEIPIKKYYSIFLEDKKKCCMALVHFVELKMEINKLYFQNPKFEQVSDFFDMEKKLSQHSSSRFGSPEKSDKEQSPKFFKQHTPSPSPMITIDNYKSDEIDQGKDDSIIIKQQ